MSAVWTALVLQVRLRSDPLAGPADPYDHILTITGRDGVAMVEGLRDDNPLKLLAHMPDLRRGLRERGFHSWSWIRRRHGGKRVVVFSTDPLPGDDAKDPDHAPGRMPA